MEAREEEEEEEDPFEKEMEAELERRARHAEKKGGVRPEQRPRQESYDAVYFDSDDEDDGELAGGGRRVLSDQELLYDPQLDAEDQRKMDAMRPRAAAHTDAVLNCPACFTLLCLDCQRHDLYPNQYRAMFVVNCTVSRGQKLKFPLTKSGRKQAGGTVKEVSDDEEFYPVRCDVCSTEVAMFDKDEVYHFFNVVPSHP